jgi:hypothetical protein
MRLIFHGFMQSGLAKNEQVQEKPQILAVLS